MLSTRAPKRNHPIHFTRLIITIPYIYTYTLYIYIHIFAHTAYYGLHFICRRTRSLAATRHRIACSQCFYKLVALLCASLWMDVCMR